MLGLCLGKEIFKAVAIAALSAVFTKAVEIAAEEAKEHIKQKRAARNPSPTETKE